MNYKVHDIHAHIVPAIDDGAINFNMSMEMLKMAHFQGTRAIVCTSHDGFDIEDYYQNLNILRKQTKKSNFDIKLFTGCEVYCSKKYIYQIIAELDNKQFLTMNETQYVLIEFNPYVDPEEIVYCVMMLHRYGYNTIIAHVERYHNLFQDNKWINILQELDCLFQINAYSLVNETNESIKFRARKLLMERRISFIGSDAHRTDRRTYMTNDGVEYIYQHCDKEYAKDICYRNAERILNMN